MLPRPAVTEDAEGHEPAVEDEGDLAGGDVVVGVAEARAGQRDDDEGEGARVERVAHRIDPARVGLVVGVGHANRRLASIAVDVEVGRPPDDRVGLTNGDRLGTARVVGVVAADAGAAPEAREDVGGRIGTRFSGGDTALDVRGAWAEAGDGHGAERRAVGRRHARSRHRRERARAPSGIRGDRRPGVGRALWPLRRAARCRYRRTRPFRWTRRATSTHRRACMRRHGPCPRCSWCKR